MKYETIGRDRDKNMICGNCGHIIMKRIRISKDKKYGFIPTSQIPVGVKENDDGELAPVVHCDNCASDCVEKK